MSLSHCIKCYYSAAFSKHQTSVKFTEQKCVQGGRSLRTPATERKPRPSGPVHKLLVIGLSALGLLQDKWLHYWTWGWQVWLKCPCTFYVPLIYKHFIFQTSQFLGRNDRSRMSLEGLSNPSKLKVYLPLFSNWLGCSPEWVGRMNMGRWYLRAEESLSPIHIIPFLTHSSTHHSLTHSLYESGGYHIVLCPTLTPHFCSPFPYHMGAVPTHHVSAPGHLHLLSLLPKMLFPQLFQSLCFPIYPSAASS